MYINIRILTYSRLIKKIAPVIARTVVNLSFKITQPPNNPPEVKPPLIICHGFLGMKENWKYIGKTLQAITKRVVVRVDLRNHGVSPHTKSNRYQEQAKDVLGLMEKLQLPQASFLGHNMGGRTAMTIALMKPSAVNSLIVLDMSPITTCDSFTTFYPKLIEAMKSVTWPEKRKVHKARKVIKEQLESLVTNDHMMKIVLANVNVKRDGTIGWNCNLDTLGRHFKYIASFPFRAGGGKEYGGPTLFIGGQLSEYLPADDLPKIRALFPQAVVKYISGAHHYVHVDELRAVLEIVIPFLKRTDQ